MNKERKYTNKKSNLYNILSVICAMGIISILLITVSFLPEFGSPQNPSINEVSQRYIEKGMEETGAVNMVAGMILDYRAFDTFGEAAMLFTATIGVITLIRNPRKGDIEDEKTNR